MYKNGQMSWYWKITFIHSEEVLISSLVPINELTSHLKLTWSLINTLHVRSAVSFANLCVQAESIRQENSSFQFLSIYPCYVCGISLMFIYPRKMRRKTFQNEPNVRTPRIRHTFFKFSLEKSSAPVKQQRLRYEPILVNSRSLLHRYFVCLFPRGQFLRNLIYFLSYNITTVAVKPNRWFSSSKNKHYLKENRLLI